MSKIFIVSLPRTGTTSICSLFLQWGFKTAHTAFTQQSFAEADVIADAPVFCDYPQLDTLFPSSRFIYLQRQTDAWLSSIKAFLEKALPKVDSHTRGFNPVISRAYKEVFDLSKGASAALQEEHLQQCLLAHEQKLNRYFTGRENDLLKLNINETNSINRLLDFLNLHESNKTPLALPHLNMNGQIVAWNKIKHPLKVSSNAPGPHGRKYFSFS